jgi:FMN phosphatase YigB (HAD superfamily)
LIDFIPLGPRYNSSILNLIINLIKKVLDPSKKQIILATVTNAKEFEELGMLRYFKHVYSMEKLNSEDITRVMNSLGFDNGQAVAIGRQVQRSTVSEIVDTTKIDGLKSA